MRNAALRKARRAHVATNPSFIPTIRSAPEFHRIVQIAGYDNPLVGYTTDQELPAVHAMANLRLTLPRRLRIELLLYCTPTSKHAQQVCSPSKEE